MKLPKPASEKEYAEYAASLDRIRREELEKPVSERDGALIEECGEGVLYCRKRLEELGPRKKPVTRNTVRAILIAAVIALLLAANVVSFASGRARLFDSLRWNVRRYRLDGAAERGVDPGNDSGIPREAEKHSFSSEEELREFFGEDLLLPGGIKAVYFVSAVSEGEWGNAQITCEYRVNGSKLLLVIDTYTGEWEDILIVPELYSDDEYSMEYHYGGMMVGESERCGFVRFEMGFDCYLLIGGQGREILEDIALKMIWSGR